MCVTEFLDPAKPLLDETVAYLCGGGRFPGKTRTAEGAASLAHLMVVLPTAQSGRMLRLALAREAARRGWGGIVPPMVAMPMQLVRSRETGALKEAGEEALAAAFLKFTGAEKDRKQAGEQLGRFEHLSGVWRVLAGGGLLMGDVPENPAARRILEATGETDRWEKLAETEKNFFAFLHDRGLMAEAERVKLAKTDPMPVPGEVEELILPALADPVGVFKDVLLGQRESLRITVLLHADRSEAHKFDMFGRPRPECWTQKERPVLRNFGESDIVISPDATAMALKAAEDFPPAEAEKETPALTVLDDAAFTETSSAFLNAGYEVHNPGAHRLAVSSLGRLARGLLELYRPHSGGYDWEAVKPVMRNDDVLKALEFAGHRREAVLEGIDQVQNKLLPVTLPEGVKTGVEAFDRAFAELCGCLDEARRAKDLAGFLLAAVRRIFRNRELKGDAKEFMAAAACFRETLEKLESETVRSLGLGEGAFELLLRRRLDEAVYGLEPDSARAIRTEGWLELAWSAKKKFALVGMHEGAVPDSVTGHPFVPDSLRTALGLQDNTWRLARDSWLMRELTDSHAPHAVRAYVSKTDSQGDICRPSRLLYLCAERELPGRTEYLFGSDEPDRARFPRQVAPSWRLRLPDEVEIKRFSPSMIDTYLKCPFTFLLKYGLKMDKLEEKRELGFDDFGTLMHAVLERYALEQLEKPEQLSDENMIAASLERIAAGVCSRYGESPSVNVQMQLDSLKGRIRAFAGIQAKWVREGWRVAERPEYKFETQPFADDPELKDATVKGTVDRIDFHPDKGYRLIDYKSWDKLAEVNSKHIACGGAKQLEFAGLMGYPLMNGKQRLLTVQLMLYKLCLERTDAKFAGRVNDLCYVVLGADAENSGEFRGSVRQPPLIGLYDLGVETAKQAIRNIRRNLFWPPGPGKEWQYDFKPLFADSPEKDMGVELAEKPGWLSRQLAKLPAG